MRHALAWLASFRLRIVFRTSFLLLAVAILAMAVAVLQEEKQRSVGNYRAGLAKTKEQIVALLHHPSGQLALLNPRWDAAAAASGRPVVLPYSAIDFDDQNKVRNAVEMTGCLVRYRHAGSLCVAIGNNPWAGGFIYAAGTFASGPLQAHGIGDVRLDAAHRVRVTVNLRGQTYRWLAPFETTAAAAGRRHEGRRGRFTGYVERDDPDYTGARPVKEFRGWVWQAGKCLDPARENDEQCPRLSFFSLRLPVDVLRDALFRGDQPVWPPPDLDQFKVHVEVLAPGDAPPLFDNREPFASPPFALGNLEALLLPGETLSIRKIGAKDNEAILISGKDDDPEQTSPLLTRLIRQLPVERLDAPIVELDDEVVTPMGTYRLHLRGDARTVNRTLSAVATRVSWFVGTMLAAVGLAWLVIEIGIVRRIGLLTRSTRGLSRTVNADGGLERYDLSDLRGHDELGLLATSLNDLLRRIKEDVERERIRTEQAKDMWHAVGHEIMSPLQSLMALHGKADDPSARYVLRMQRAIQVLYGSASPSEAFESSTLQIGSIDIEEFLGNVAANASCVGIENVRFDSTTGPVRVRADEHSLEDVVIHVLRNADRYRHPGTPITLTLTATETLARVAVHDAGPPIAEDMLERIFEYGVSDQPEAGAQGNRGQGLFVARTYMAKMGGTITAHNVADGVELVLSLARVKAGLRG